jgi:SAM-dependent methyltransferase
MADAMPEHPHLQPPRHELGAWPSGGVETVGACPVCGSAKRDLLFTGLEDRIFDCAPGKWDMQRCRECGSGYLDPRPTAETIGLAYREYHTHQPQERLPASQLSGLRRLRRSMANGYKNWRFGTDLQPSSKLGKVAAFLVPGWRAILDRQYRNLSRGSAGRVLDVGCGDGGFLENAVSIGWSAVGTDFDPTVVDNARKRGLDVRLGTVDGIEGPFDVVTLSHVIEHVYDPHEVLRACFEVLAPGGRIWIETPNIDALGLKWFGRHWRGLEPPRHLVLFNSRSLALALERAGFQSPVSLKSPSAALGMVTMSKALQAGENPADVAPLSASVRLQVATMRIIEHFNPTRREFLAVVASKPLVHHG